MSLVEPAMSGIGLTGSGRSASRCARWLRGKANREDTKKFIETLNKKLGEAGLEQARLDDSFNRWRDDLEAALSGARPLLMQKSHRNVNPKICSERF